MGYTNISDSDSGSDPPTPTTASDEESANDRTPILYTHHDRRSTSLSTPYLPRNPKGAITESEEIWEELEDDPVSPLAPFHHHNRRASIRSTPSRDRPQSGDGAPNESTALLARSGTGRSYRDRRRRSTPGFGTQASSNGRDIRRHSGQQEAVGGWWKMRWWRKRRKEGGRDGEG